MDATRLSQTIRATGSAEIKVTLSTKRPGDADWSSTSETYRYATIWVPSRRRHWWQVWRPKGDRMVWSGPISG